MRARRRGCGMRRRSVASVVALGLGILSGSCGQADQPSFVSLEIWEGYLANPGEPVLRRRVEPMPDGSFVLRSDILHLARVTLRSSGQPDRCLFRPFFYSWARPNRDYECYPEAQDGEMTIDVPFSTWKEDWTRVSDHQLGVQLSEHGAGQVLLGVYDIRRYAVSFAD